MKEKKILYFHPFTNTSALCLPFPERKEGAEVFLRAFSSSQQ
tara:strand:- start:127 stop:252 length:126 start_codon:yes stop_codon:yes gene_type:complete